VSRPLRGHRGWGSRGRGQRHAQGGVHRGRGSASRQLQGHRGQGHSGRVSVTPAAGSQGQGSRGRVSVMPSEGSQGGVRGLGGGQGKGRVRRSQGEVMGGVTAGSGSDGQEVPTPGIGIIRNRK
jgi:hypothetical protein